MQLRRYGSNCRRRNKPRLLTRPALGNDAALVRARRRHHRARCAPKATPRSLISRRDSTASSSYARGSAEEFALADGRSTEPQRAAIRAAAANIETFHRPQLPRGVRRRHGSRRALRACGSTDRKRRALRARRHRPAALDGADARRAGADRGLRHANTLQPRAGDGRVDAAVLYAARVAGVQRVFKLGGAQAIAAHGVRHRERAEGRQGIRPRQHLGHRSEGASGSRSRRRGARLPSGAFRGARHRRRQRQCGVRRGGPAVAGGARRGLAGAARDDEPESSGAPSSRPSLRRRRA